MLKPKLSQKTKTIHLAILVAFVIGFAALGSELLYGRNSTQNPSAHASAQEPADLNDDNQVDVFDLSLMLAKWGTADAVSDINKDGSVNVFDLSMLLAKWDVVAGSERSCPGKPDASCTGLPPNTPLTIVNGDLTVSTDGTIVDGQDIRGFLVIQASNVTVKNTIVRGRAASSNGAYINIRSGTNITIQDTEVSPTTPSVYLDGLWGSNFVGKRLNIRGGVDGMKIYDNVRIESSYIHDMASFASDPNQGGGSTHNDAVQILRGTNISMSGNNFVLSNSQNAAIQITQDFGVVSGVLAENNWMDGGGCTVNVAHKVQPSLTGVSLQNNRFGRNSYWNCPILLSTQSNVTRSGNVFDDNNQAVPVQVHD